MLKPTRSLTPVARELILREITQKIRQSLDLSIVFEAAVSKIRGFMDCDRVGIFKFQSDFNFDEGKFIAEAVAAGFLHTTGLTTEIPTVGTHFSGQDRHSSISATADIYTAGLQDCQIEILTKFQVQAALIVPLFNGSILWGLLCLQQCAADRLWHQGEIESIEQIAAQIGIAIQQATLYKKVQLELQIRWQAEAEIALQLRQQQTIGSISEQIRNSLTVAEILTTATQQVKELMMVDRATIIRLSPDGKIQAIEEAVSPEYPSRLGMHWDDEKFTKEGLRFYLQGKPRTVFNVTQDPFSSCWEEDLIGAQVKSKIVAPILLPAGTSETDRWVSPSGDLQLWGLLIVDACSAHRHWQDTEAKLLQQVANQLAIAIHQASLFEQLQSELAERKQAETQLLERNQELALSNQQLARATHLKDEFLASMSHELRTPLNAILGMSEALQGSRFGSLTDRQRNSIVTIEKSGKHLLALINDILDLSKIEANKFNLELTDVSIQALCQNSLLFIKELAHKRQIQVKIQLPDYLKQLNIRVDNLRCRQVLINLLSNAVKFTPEGGSITLDVRVVEQQPQPQIVFSIVDTGIGIAAENIDKLFQSFVQIDSSLSRQYAGTGLGLALVKQIVELHGGSVSVKSEVNCGSCFAVSLPFDPSAIMATAPSLSPLTLEPDETPTLRPKASILIVEDNDANMETMTGYLKSRGYQLIEARSGEQAISILGLAQTDCPDMILMDIQMPGMDGFEATRRIRQMPECAAIPIIALTALAMPSDRQKCLDAGANHYVTKPVKLGQLVLTIESLLNSD
jgi:signal transduction histidine kinase/ActR/RegA family two-component response regulator